MKSNIKPQEIMILINDTVIKEIVTETNDSMILTKVINNMEVISVFPKHITNSEQNFEAFLQKLNRGTKAGYFERRDDG